MHGRHEALAEVTNLVEPAARAELLEELGQRLALPEDKLHELAALDVGELEGQVIRLTVRQGLDATKARAHEAQQRAARAAVELSRTASWQGDAVHVEPRLLLGPVLAHPGSKHIGFELGQEEPIFLEKARLRPARRALAPFHDLCAWLDKAGLHLRWHGGRGGLDLFARVLSPYERKQAYVVTIVRPVEAEPAPALQADIGQAVPILDERPGYGLAPSTAQPVSCPAPARAPRTRDPSQRAANRGTWLADVLSDLGLLG